MKYRLKKDLPFAKVGKIVDVNYVADLWTVRPLDAKKDYPVCDIPENAKEEWIEEVKPREWDVLVFNNKISSYGILLFSSTDGSVEQIKVREVLE